MFALFQLSIRPQLVKLMSGQHQWHNNNNLMQHSNILANKVMKILCFLSWCPGWLSSLMLNLYSRRTDKVASVLAAVTVTSKFTVTLLTGQYCELPHSCFLLILLSSLYNHPKIPFNTKKYAD